jgi:hypothetical protein
MTGRAFCGALLLAAAFSGQGLLRAQTTPPTELPDAPHPQESAGFDNAPPALNVAQANGDRDDPLAALVAEFVAAEPLVLQNRAKRAKPTQDFLH